MRSCWSVSRLVLVLLSASPAWALADAPVPGASLAAEQHSTTYADGALVVVFTRDAELKSGEQVLAKLSLGEGLLVRGGQRDYLKVYRLGQLGWIARDQVIPLDQALAVFTKMVEQEPNDAVVRIARARILGVEQELDQAIAEFSEAIKLDPKLAAARRGRGVAWSMKGDSKRAIADLNAAVRLDPTDTMALYARGGLLSGDDLESAIADFSEVLRLEPSNAAALSAIGSLRCKAGDAKQGIADLTEAIRLEPTVAKVHYNRGCAYSEMKDYPHAIADLTEAIRLDAGYTKALHARGCAYAEKGDEELAMADFAEVVRLYGDVKPATPIYELADAHEKRAMANLARKDFDAALAEFTKAIDFGAKNANVYCGRGCARLTKNEIIDAIADLNEAIGLDPNRIESFSNRAAAYWALGEYDETADDFKKVVALQCADPRILIHIAYFLAACPIDKHRDGKQAVELAKRAFDLTEHKEPNDYAIYAAAHAEAGNFTQAVQLQKSALALMSKATPDEIADARKRLDLYSDRQPYRFTMKEEIP